MLCAAIDTMQADVDLIVLCVVFHILQEVESVVMAHLNSCEVHAVLWLQGYHRYFQRRREDAVSVTD